MVFGNQGGLYMNAMTWFDHDTDSVWTQVTGEALYGPMEGTRLKQIPAAIEAWSAWRRSHPDTRVLRTPEGYVGEPIDRDFVIGVRIGDDAAAFAFPTVVERRVLNDEVGEVPIAVHARPDRQVRVYAREVQGRVVTLRLEDGFLVDGATGSRWHPVTGQGVDGPLAGQPLASVAWMSSFDWAWEDFHPHSRIVR